MLIPQVVVLIPGYVFLETTLAYLNMSDPYLPTWGKLLLCHFAQLWGTQWRYLSAGCSNGPADVDSFWVFVYCHGA